MLNQNGLDSRTFKTSSVLINQGSYPKAPDISGNDLILCDWCAQPLDKADLEPGRWSQHVDRDLKPYICLVEECAEHSSGYATFKEWFNHMQHHGQAWSQDMHQSPTWICPMCEESDDAFGDSQALLVHMKESHAGILSDSQLDTIGNRSRVFKPRPIDECLLCGFRVQETKMSSQTIPYKRQSGTFKDNSNKRAKIENQVTSSHPNGDSNQPETGSNPDLLKAMAQHIASHLQGLMFLAIRIASVHMDEGTQQLQDIKSDAVDTEEALTSCRDADLNDFSDTRTSENELELNNSVEDSAPPDINYFDGLTMAARDPKQSLNQGDASNSPGFEKQSGLAPRDDGSSPIKQVDRKPAHDFLIFVENTRRKCVGRNGLGERQSYVPYEDLHKYWQPESIRTLCRSFQPNITFDVTTMKFRYLRTFSLLVYINKVPSLDIFVRHRIFDGSFTLEENDIPAILKTAGNRDLIKDLLSYQWLFYPLVLDSTHLHGRPLPDRTILPFDSEEQIRSSNSSTITKVAIRRSCNSEVQALYIIKTYLSGHRCENERMALTVARGLKSQHIVKYHGSFVQNNNYSLVLDYVNGGNLAEYFQITMTPPTEHDAWLFWNSMSGVWKGLAGFHGLVPKDDAGNEASDTHLWVHGDLWPDNILISRKGVTSNSPYDFIPIISDFGHSFVRNGINLADELVPDHYCNREFAAPEASQLIRYPLFNHLRSDAGADVWSMGCIQSVAGVWVAMGMHGINTYKGLRRTEFSNVVSCFEDKDLIGCFHNGTDPLEAVATTHAIIAGRYDSFTVQAVKIAERFCIVGDRKARLSAHEIHELICQALGKEHSGVKTSEYTVAHSSLLSPRPPLSLAPQRSRLALMVPQQLSDLTGPTPQRDTVLRIQECHDWANADKAGGNVVKSVDTTIRRLQRQLKGRNHIFLIEDSPSMGLHREEMSDVFLTLSHIAKAMDPNRIELLFASQPSTVHKPSYIPGREEKPLRDAFRKCPFDLVDGSMEENLGEVVDSIIRDRLPVGGRSSAPPVSLFIFTDGSWGNDRLLACGVERPIRKLVDAAKKYGDRTQVMVQFVRFGDDENGIRCLDYLDKFGNDVNWDIVDHTSISGNIFTLFSGSFRAISDGDGESAASPKQT